METYPDILPSWKNDYGYSSADDMIRTDVQGGPVFVKKISAGSMRTITVSAKITSDQLCVLEAWIKERINNGLNWFLCPVVMASGIEHHIVRIVGKPTTAMLLPGFWTLTMRIEMEV